MIQNMKLCTNIVDRGNFVCYHPFVWSFQSITAFWTAAFCTILESFDSKGVWPWDVPNWYAHLMTTPLAVQYSLNYNSVDWTDQTKGW